MVDTKKLLKASLNASRDFLRFSRPAANCVVPALVPIHSLGPAHQERILRHLLTLDLQDRYLRFGYAASDEQIRRYSGALDFERDEIFGIYNRRLELIALSHLAFPPEGREADGAEFGVSVLKSARGRGYGARLFERAAMNARNAGVEVLYIHALSENAAMLRIARNAGAKVVRDGSESQAHLQLPLATLDTRMAELVEKQFAEMDFQLKAQAKQFREILGNVQEVRGGMRNARHRSGT